MTQDLGPQAEEAHDPVVLAAKLRDEVDAYIRDHGMSQEAFARSAGIHRKHVEQFLKNGGREGYRVEVPTAEKLARAIGKRLTLEPIPDPQDQRTEEPSSGDDHSDRERRSSSSG